MSKVSNSQNFVNPAFAAIYDGITANMPAITFYGIIATYLITAALNVFFIPLPVYLAAPAALAIQFGRFAIVFMDFLNPTGRKSPWPALVATVATGAALAELSYSIAGKFDGNEFWAILLFGGMVIAMGYLLEINFIAKGAEAFGMTRKERTAGAITAAMGNGQAPAVARPTLPASAAPEELAEKGRYVYLDDFLRTVNAYEERAGRPSMTEAEIQELAKRYATGTVHKNGQH